MVALVHSYLDKYYTLKIITDNGEASICKLLDNPERYSTYPNTLLKELNTVFSVNENDLKAWVNSWATIQQFDVDLTEWWKREEFNPIRIDHITGEFELDLISIQPLPTGLSIHFEYVYLEETLCEKIYLRIKLVVSFLMRIFVKRNKDNEI